MSKTDWALVALNVLTLLMAVMGLTAQDLDPMTGALALTVFTSLINGGWALRRSRVREMQPIAPRQLDRADEMDIHRVLDIDQRLEALERAEARRLQGLLEDSLSVDPGSAHHALPTRQRV